MAELYDGPIVDAHHHFWDPANNPHPWLSGSENIPFRYGDYSAIKRRYFPQDYFADAGTHQGMVINDQDTHRRGQGSKGKSGHDSGTSGSRQCYLSVGAVKA